MHDTTQTIEASDVEQITGYANALGLQAPTIRRLPVDRRLGGLLTGIVFGQDPRLVFLHGGQLSAHTWDGVILRAGLPALAYDLPGHGHSLRLPPDCYTHATIAELLAQRILVDTDSSTGITLVGHSFGAMLGVLVAGKLGQRVDSLIILDATPHGIGTGVDDPDTVLVGTFDELVDSVHARVPHRSRESLIRGVGLNTRLRGDGLWEWCWDPHFKSTSHVRRVERDQLWSAMESLQVPITLVRGEKSEKVTRAMLEEVKERRSSTQILSAPGAGHNVHTDAPDWTSELVISAFQLNSFSRGAS